MRIALFTEALLSDWGHPHAHFLRGTVGALLDEGHEVRVHETGTSAAARGLRTEAVHPPPEELDAAWPALRLGTAPPVTVDPTPDLDALLEGVDVVWVHGTATPGIVAALGRRRVQGAPFLLLYQDARSPDPRVRLVPDLSAFDAVLAPGRAARDAWARLGWGPRAITWYPAVDDRLFAPRRAGRRVGELVFVGNWRPERADAVRRYLVEAVRQLDLDATVFGVGYPSDVLRAFSRAAVRYRGHLPNHRVPEVHAHHLVTLHLPCPGTASGPSIRLFEALATGIPVVSAPWDDPDGLLAPGSDYLLARDPEHARELLRALLHDSGFRDALARRGRETVLSAHTCAHRARELVSLVEALQGRAGPRAAEATEPATA